MRLRVSGQQTGNDYDLDLVMGGDVADSGLPYRFGPMGTCLEGDWDQVLGVIAKCYQRMSADCNRISVSIKIDARAGHDDRLDSKIQTVEQTLGRKLDT